MAKVIPTKVYLKSLHTIFEQFGQIDALVPRQPKYVYINMILDNGWSMIKSRRVAGEVLELWKKIKSEYTKIT